MATHGRFKASNPNVYEGNKEVHIATDHIRSTRQLTAVKRLYEQTAIPCCPPAARGKPNNLAFRAEKEREETDWSGEMAEVPSGARLEEDGRGDLRCREHHTLLGPLLSILPPTLGSKGGDPRSDGQDATVRARPENITSTVQSAAPIHSLAAGPCRTVEQRRIDANSKFVGSRLGGLPCRPPPPHPNLPTTPKSHRAFLFPPSQPHVSRVASPSLRPDASKTHAPGHWGSRPHVARPGREWRIGGLVKFPERLRGRDRKPVPAHRQTCSEIPDLAALLSFEREGLLSVPTVPLRCTCAQMVLRAQLSHIVVFEARNARGSYTGLASNIKRTF
ncbi:hypothetical protein BDK51DRAFT_29739 [Blyttiomyces helicus]|uniref:Uncharacterized protein n=1 Tax=Blyttiomyces helicus TaxID=388810 RepID=A0A4P9VX39_9FUNG|nr:hypothetical protein BDK51DRAFT_29739 [Blyttiomyces helicus]|eukprot:RKO83263.1 hypothetical protein BDK51DRAFT_29739 [Blyttiomyces helicus]